MNDTVKHNQIFRADEHKFLQILPTTPVLKAVHNFFHRGFATFVTFR
jgi:hypothetical protein